MSTFTLDTEAHLTAYTLLTQQAGRVVRRHLVSGQVGVRQTEE